MVVKHSGVKCTLRFIKKANFAKLKIRTDQVDSKLDLVSFNPVGRQSDDSRKIHKALLFKEVISDPVDATVYFGSKIYI